MLFQSATYLFVFLPATWILYLWLRHTPLRAIFLTVSGYIFYAWGVPWAVFLLFLSSTVDFLIGLKLHEAKSGAARKMWLIGSIVFNIGLLCFFKYGDWLIGYINLLIGFTGHPFRIPLTGAVLPPGISFYTFQSLSYVIDIYRRQMPAHRKIWDYWAFVAFFPQLIAGPIERAKNLLEQIVHPRRHIHPRMIESGIFLIAWGVFKKLVIADNLANLVQLCRDAPNIPTAGLVLALAFTFQIYADFSAYTDIARGSARMFGIRLRRNFNTPYFAHSPSDFWARWHISLSTWIRDYIYVPLGGNKRGKLMTLRNLLITMFLAGLWHGAGFPYIFWGLYHGFLLVAYRIFPLDAYLRRTLGRPGLWLARLIMFALVAAGWVLFLAGSYPSFENMFSNPKGMPVPEGFDPVILWYGLFVFSWPLLLTDVIGFRKRREFVDLWPHFPAAVKTLLYLGIFYAIVFFGARGNNEFIYFQF